MAGLEPRLGEQSLRRPPLSAAERTMRGPTLGALVLGASRRRWAGVVGGGDRSRVAGVTVEGIGLGGCGGDSGRAPGPSRGSPQLRCSSGPVRAGTWRVASAGA